MIEQRALLRVLVLALPGILLSSELEGARRLGPARYRSERQAHATMFARAYVPGRSGQLFIVPERGTFLLSRADTVFYRFMHGSPWDYDVRIPLLFYGPSFVRQGIFSRQATLQDVAPSLLTILRSPIPSTMTGVPLTEAIRTAPKPPAAVVLIVLDGLGASTWNRMNASLPTLSRLRRNGAWFGNAALNYLPSVTSTGHATVSTGTDPRFHGIQGNSTFDRKAGVREPFPDMNPAGYTALTLADHWNHMTFGQAVIAAQGTTPRATVALAGHGACTPNGRPILMAMFDDKRAGWVTNDSCFRLPDYLREHRATRYWSPTPASWLGHQVNSGRTFLRSGLFPAFQADALIQIIEQERIGRDSIPDLLLVNFKTPDYVTHLYGPESPEADNAIKALDHELGRCVQALDASVGSERYVIVITADHGMPPEPRFGRYYVEDVRAAFHAAFDSTDTLIPYFEDADNQVYVDLGRLASLRLTLSDLARFAETLPFIRYAITEDEIRAVRLR